ncbi:MAG: FprA family A-type flavoprotein [Lachnospiraceae bacterium]|nr:FprA family A-type flavoprotein [Lachnospiraceae bacterium]
MINYKAIAEDTIWIGGSDRRLELFENLFPLPNGVSYNSYLVLDEKNIAFDTADVTVADQYIENLKAALGGKKLDYLVILHMEPDHCSQIANVASLYPEVTLVGNTKSFTMLGQFFPELASMKKIVVREGEKLSTGKHEFTFVMAPMVHWPEVMMAYDSCTGAFFSADAFGTFGAVDSGIFADCYNFERDFLDDARRYYANIVGKYGVQVQAVLKKAAKLDIRMICPLHGPVWRENIAWFIDKYQKWSTYTPDEEGIVVFYGSLYGHTASAAEAFAAKLREKAGCEVRVFDVSKTHSSKLISEIWRVGKIVIFCPTYNNGIYLPVDALLHDMAALDVKNRTFAVAQNGTWAPASGKLICEKLAALKNVKIIEPLLTIKSALHEKDMAALDAFVDAVAGA